MRVTENAIAWLHAIDFPVDRVLRLEPAGDEQLMLAFGDPQTDDRVSERDGQDLLPVSPTLDAALFDAELDRVDTDEGSSVAVFSYDWDATDGQEPETYEARD